MKLLCLLLAALCLGAQTQTETAIDQQVHSLRKVPDSERGAVTKNLALRIRQLPASASRLSLASDLANLATEGDFGHETLQEVATTLAEALREKPIRADQNGPALPYVTLAQLARYEHVNVSLDDSQYAAALAKLEADDLARQQADFTLTDLQGKEWTLKSLEGKVVLVNFWATWCPPCRKEIPDLDALYSRFKDSGFVILGISDEVDAKVRPFATAQKIKYPILLDPGRKVTERFRVAGIPKSFIYDREGKLAAQSIDIVKQPSGADRLVRGRPPGRPFWPML
jgi:peroxiredoxin